MKSNADHIPATVSQSAGKYHIAYNIKEVIREDMDGTQRVSYDYEYVAIDKLERGVIVDAIISETYSKDAEIALINNEITNPGTQEYADYQALREFAKSVADEALGFLM